MGVPGKPKISYQNPKTEQGRQLLRLKRQNAVGFDWRQVDTVTLKAALTCALLADGAVMFSGAAGGRGVCLKVFIGGDRVTEYATDAEELTQLLDQVIDQLQPTSEDVREAMHGEPYQVSPTE